MKKNWVRVVEALIVSAMSATTAFVLIYFYHDCKPIGAANISRPLQVSGIIFRYIVVLDFIFTLTFIWDIKVLIPKGIVIFQVFRLVIWKVRWPHG